MTDSNNLLLKTDIFLDKQIDQLAEELQKLFEQPTHSAQDILAIRQKMFQYKTLLRKSQKNMAQLSQHLNGTDQKI